MSTCREDHEDWCPAKHLDAQPCACMRRQIDAALAIHAPRCGRCCVSADQCTGQEDWREEYDRHDPQLECPVCVADWACEETEPYPCPTARALGVRVPSETTGEPA